MIVFTLKERLHELGVTMNKFATICKVRPSTVADFVNNKVERPEISTLNKFINGLTLITVQRGKPTYYTLHDIMYFEFKQEELDSMIQEQEDK